MTWNYDAQPKETPPECNLCLGYRFEAFANRDRYGLSVTSVKCCDCGLVFLRPRMTAEAYAEFYGNGIYRDLVNKVNPSAKKHSEGSRLRYAFWVGAVLADHLNNRSGTLLDVGGSEGQVSDAIARRFKFTPTVLEPSEEEGAKARILGLDVIKGSLETWDPEGRRFDVVTLCQTVDHLLDIRGGLNKIRSLLNRGGLFFVDISDYRSVLHKVGLKEKAIKVDHPFYLTPLTMERYLRGAQFDIVDRMNGFMGYAQAFVCEAL